MFHARKLAQGDWFDPLGRIVVVVAASASLENIIGRNEDGQQRCAADPPTPS